MKLIWLDDIRNPKKFCKTYNDYDEIIWVKNFKEFIYEINNNYKNPDNISISFDHDLGEDATGYDCAKYLVNFCLDYNLNLPKNFFVHSANPVGAENIRMLLNNFDLYRRCNI